MNTRLLRSYIRTMLTEAPVDPELSAMPKDVTIKYVRKVGDGPPEVMSWTGDRDAINTTLAVAGLDRDARFRILNGEGGVPPKAMQMLRTRGVVSRLGGAKGPKVPREPGTPRVGTPRMTGPGAQNRLLTLVKRFAAGMADAGIDNPDVNPEDIAMDSSGSFFATNPDWQKLAAVAGLKELNVKEMVADHVYDAIMKGLERHKKQVQRPVAPPKETYKVYGKKGEAPAHTRLKGQAFLAPPDTQFKSGERATIAPDSGKLKVSKTDSDHSQLWDPE